MNTGVWIIDPSGEPNPGHYKTRLVKGGPFVPVELAVTVPPQDEDGELLADVAFRLTINGEEKDPFGLGAPLSGERITAAEYAYLDAMRRHAVTHEPDMPEANPRQKVDFNTLRFNF